MTVLFFNYAKFHSAFASRPGQFIKDFLDDRFAVFFFTRRLKLSARLAVLNRLTKAEKNCASVRLRSSVVNSIRFFPPAPLPSYSPVIL